MNHFSLETADVPGKFSCSKKRYKLGKEVTFVSFYILNSKSEMVKKIVNKNVFV